MSRPRWLVLGSLLLCACEVKLSVYTCQTNRDCIDSQLQQDICVFIDGAGYCADQTLGCPSGLRWGLTAREDLRQRCVRPELLPPGGDGGIDASLTD